MIFQQTSNPETIEPFFSIPKKENPSYGTEMPQDFPYDPGATSTIFELGYMPSKSSLLPFILMGVVVFGVFFYMIKSKISFRTVTQNLAVLAILFVFLGPLMVPSFLPFKTVIGIAKVLGVFLVIYSFIDAYIKRHLIILGARSFLPISLYLLTILFSVFTMTNENFFVADLSLIIGGLLFYYIGYVFLDTDQIRRLAIRSLAILALFPALLVLTVYLFKDRGIDVISGIYPQYENLVFTFDLARGRILSIIDLEFFVPCVLYVLTTNSKRLLWIVEFILISSAVFLTNYRYRFLSYIAGFASYLWLIKTKSKKIIVLILLATLTGTFSLYIFTSLMFGQVNIIDRFLLKSYSDDVDSLQRRVVMMGQAWELFRQHPIIGVGTGNYKDNVQIVYESFGGRFYEPFYKILQNVYAYPHNWFLLVLAENGIIGFLAVLYLLYVFAKTDIYLYKKLKGDSHSVFLAYCVTTWLYIFANQFTPLHNSQSMVIFFWVFRGIVDRIYQQHKEKSDAR